LDLGAKSSVYPGYADQIVLLAVIRESECVGCAKCLPACPVDAIIGASGFLHSVLTEECIGCGLCVEPCPMDCIEMIESPIQDGSLDKAERAANAKKRYQSRIERLSKQTPVQLLSSHDPAHKRSIQKEIAEAVQRVQKKRDSHERTTMP
jgi:Na+-translocating ferredoxin:NAD+ oxidoreductase subunit B